MYGCLEQEKKPLTLEEVASLVKHHVADHHWKQVLLLPPDITRLHSGAGKLTALYYRELSARGTSVSVMPALGTHVPMTRAELQEMFGESIPCEAYLQHDFRRDIQEVGIIPGEYINSISGGLFTQAVRVEINRKLLQGDYDAIISIGQVVPHEIAGMANYTKNIVVGCGGGEIIHVSHFLGVFCGLENILGRDKNPVRLLFDYAQERLLSHLPITFVQTVMTQIDGEDHYMGIYIGEDREPYERAVALSKKVNFCTLDRPARCCVVWMDPHSYHSTWVTNKAIYRTQLAVERGGEIIIIAPGVHMFGENDAAEQIIRTYGYQPREKILQLCKTEKILQDNLSLTGHLIHGAPEGISVTYCTDRLSREEIEHAGFRHMSVSQALERYPVGKWKNGWHTLPDGKEIYFVSNAALGMWRYGGT